MNLQIEGHFNVWPIGYPIMKCLANLQNLGERIGQYGLHTPAKSRERAAM